MARHEQLSRQGSRRTLTELAPARTAGEMAIQAGITHHAIFSAQQGLVRLVGHRIGVGGAQPLPREPH